VYDDIQRLHKDSNTIVSLCPNCGYLEGHFFNHKFVFDYNAGDGPNGVPPYLVGEGDYDWDWLTYKKGKVVDNSSKDFDQDEDLINNNLGWED
jgi:hypothetical protein